MKRGLSVLLVISALFLNGCALAAGTWDNTFSALLEHKLAQASEINDRVDALGSNFDFLPLPRDDGKLGFDGPCAVGDATEDIHAVNVKTMREGGFTYGIDTGVANAYVVTLSIAPTAYAEGMQIVFKAVNANTGASTINVNGLGAVDIKLDSSQDLYSGYINAGDIVEIYHNGTNFQITSLATKVVQDSADGAAQSASDAAADLVLTNADVVLTNADVVFTNADVVSTNADVVTASGHVDSAKSYASGEAPLGEPGTGSAKYWAEQSASSANGVNNNLLINPNFLINQEEYIDNTNLTSIGDYTYDMWMTTTSSGENGVSVSGENITLEAVASLEQINDDLIANSGKSVTISLESGTVDITGGGISGTQTLTSSVSYSFTLAVTSSDGIVVKYESPGVFSGLKLELGVNATDYNIPKITEDELRCYRYYYAYIDERFSVMGRTATTTSVFFNSLLFPVTMRTTPAITLLNDSYLGDGSYVSSSQNLDTPQGFRLEATITGGTVDSLAALGFKFIADARY